VTKVAPGRYRLENREYEFKVMQGNNLCIKMFAGYIYVESLRHFDEEIGMLVNS